MVKEFRPQSEPSSVGERKREVDHEANMISHVIGHVSFPPAAILNNFVYPSPLHYCYILKQMWKGCRSQEKMEAGVWSR